MKLRTYQKQLVDDVYDQLDLGIKRIGIFAGCGAGKTVVSAQLIQDFVDSGMRILFCVHLDVLVEQTAQKIEALGLRCGFIKAGFPEDLAAPIQIASIQTMAKRQWWRRWSADVVFLDEAHITLFSQIGMQLMYSSHPNAIYLALTGTPKRLGREQLGDHLEAAVTSPTPAELTRMGYLAPLQYFSLGEPNLVGAGLDGDGEYQEKDLKIACDRPELVNRAVLEWLRLTPGKRTIAFCVDVDHANRLADEFRRFGVAAATVDGSTPINERNTLYQDLASGKLLVLTSCNVVSIGFDEPSVEVGMLLRPTQSEALHFQQVGRVMRLSPRTGKTHGIILDQAGNLQRLGFPEDIWRYELPHSKQQGSTAPAPKKECPDCGALVHCFVMRCQCGYEWQRHEVIDLSELTQVYPLQRLQSEPGAIVKLFHQHRQNAAALGRPPEWAEQQMQAYPGITPDPTWYYGSLYGHHTSPAQKLAALQYLRQFSADPAWIEQQFDLEYGRGSLRKLAA